MKIRERIYEVAGAMMCGGVMVLIPGVLASNLALSRAGFWILGSGCVLAAFTKFEDPSA